MRFWNHAGRALLTSLGVAAFVVLASGSKEDKHPLPATPPEVAGQRDALSWATSNSAALATKIEEVQSEKSHARSEISRLENLKRQFPAQGGRIQAVVSDWRQVEIELGSALTSVEQGVAKAYVAHQVEGEDRDTLLREVYDQWRPQADRAIALAKRQQAASSGTREGHS